MHEPYKGSAKPITIEARYGCPIHPAGFHYFCGWGWQSEGGLQLNNTKTYFFKINPNDVLAELVFVENRGEWLLQFFIDLKNGDPEKATSTLASEIIKEAHEYRAKKAEAGKNGGLAKASSAKQNLAVLDSAKPEVKQNVANSSSNSSKPKPYSIEFESFWEVYPWKTAKGKAWDSWQKANPPLSTVLSALEWQCKSEKWTKDNGEYIPMPATYINQKRWEDKPLSIVAKPESQKGYGYAY